MGAPKETNMFDQGESKKIDKPKSIYSLFEMDKAMEEQGIVVDFGDYGRFKIARAGGGNQRFAECFTRRYRPYKRQQETDSLPEDVGRRLLAEIYADAVLKDWEGVYDREGKPIPFTHAAVVQLFVDLPELFVQIRNAAGDAALYRREEIQEIAGN